MATDVRSLSALVLLCTCPVMNKALAIDHVMVGRLTVEEVRAALESGAFDIEAPGVDVLAGFGLIDAAASGDAIAVPEPPDAWMLAVGIALLAALSRCRRCVP